jgi:hypothetical protein
MAVPMQAQQGPRPFGRKSFDPKKFEAQLEQFVTVEAGLTPYEASLFFPLYREMRRKQMFYFNVDRKYRHIDFNDERQCLDAITEKDKADIKMKEIQMEYHKKFLKVLPATKVFKVIRAEDKFHRQAFDRAVRRRSFNRQP